MRWRTLFPRRQTFNTSRPLFSYDKHLSGPPLGRALLSYLPQPVSDELAGHPENEFSNRGIARAWPKVLNELGFIVDVVSWDDNAFHGKQAYDLLIQHGGRNYQSLKNFLKTDAKMVYFSTGSYWKYHNAAEKSRFADFKKRHGFMPPYDRLISESEEAANAEADGIIALGNTEVAKTYSKFKNVYHLNLASYPDPKRTRPKAAAKTRDSYLFFGSGGAIHKGLDITLEAFADLTEQLYIAAYIEEAVRPALEPLFQKPNVHLIGPVDFRSERYYELMDKCSFAILPSCSEGQPGSIVECLAEGLIPVVTKDVHLDVGDYGYLLISASISAIKRQVKTLSSLSGREINHRSAAAKQAALSEHSPNKFRSELKRLVQAIIEAKA